MKNKINDHINSINSLQLFGLDSYFNNFVDLYKKNKFPKVSLFSGNKGIGKFTLTFHLLNYFLSKDLENPYDIKNKTINKNNFIYKQILSNISQNFIYISNENQSKTSIEQIREIKKTLNNSTLNNAERFIIFDDVELLNINSANSLLKIIEEPSDTNFFILINNKRAPVIETIKSRSIETNFFLNEKDKEKIFFNLLNLNPLNENFSHQYIKYTTPGLLYKFSEIINENNIQIESEFSEIVSFSLEKFKKTKNELFLDFIKFFLEIKSEKINITNSVKFLNSVNEKNNLMRLLYKYKKFNLTNNVVLNFIKKTTNYYA